jgi:hypothetical protein
MRMYVQRQKFYFFQLYYMLFHPVGRAASRSRVPRLNIETNPGQILRAPLMQLLFSWTRTGTSRDRRQSCNAQGKKLQEKVPKLAR